MAHNFYYTSIYRQTKIYQQLKKYKPYDFWVNISKCVDEADNSGFRSDLSKATIVEIDTRLISLIQETDNEIFFRPTPFIHFFINTDLMIKLNTGREIELRGTLVTNSEEIGVEINGQIIRERDLFVTSTLWGKNDIMLISLSLYRDIYQKGWTENLELNLNEAKDFQKKIRTVICNIIDTIENNDADIDIVRINISEEQQIKRAGKGKPPLPNKVYIRPKLNFIQYLNKYHSAKNKPASYKYLIRGHWRHYRHERYSQKLRGKPQWIKPFYKGQGIVISKIYKVVP